MRAKGALLAERLDWDSHFFGIPTARVSMPVLDAQALSSALADLGREGVRLVYVHSKDELPPGTTAVEAGLLVDAKTTYVANVANCTAAPDVVDDVRPYVLSDPLPEIEALAVQAGAFSRFFVDPNIGRDRAVALYKTWLARSVSREIAEEVLLAEESQRIVGLVTLGEKNGRGDIGLLAVDDRSRGKGHGRALVRSALSWFKTRGHTSCQVVSQGANAAARRLYSACGFQVESVEYIYHFWLQPERLVRGPSSP